MHVQRAAQVDVDERVPFLGPGLGEVLEAVPACVIHQNVHRLAPERLLSLGVLRDVENQSRAADLAGDALGGFALLVGDQDFHVPGKAPADRAANGAAAPSDEDRLHLGRC